MVDDDAAEHRKAASHTSSVSATYSRAESALPCSVWMSCGRAAVGSGTTDDAAVSCFRLMSRGCGEPCQLTSLTLSGRSRAAQCSETTLGEEYRYSNCASARQCRSLACGTPAVAATLFSPMVAGGAMDCGEDSRTRNRHGRVRGEHVDSRSKEEIVSRKRVFETEEGCRERRRAR